MVFMLIGSRGQRVFRTLSRSLAPQVLRGGQRADLLPHGATDLRRVPVVHAVINPRIRNFADKVVDPCPTANPTCRVGLELLSLGTGPAPISAWRIAPTVAA
jgi:hypothetical protein